MITDKAQTIFNKMKLKLKADSSGTDSVQQKLFNWKKREREKRKEILIDGTLNVKHERERQLDDYMLATTKHLQFR